MIEPDILPASGKGVGPMAAFPLETVSGAPGKRGGERLASYHLRLAPVIKEAGPRMRVDPRDKGLGVEAQAHSHLHESMTHYLSLSL